MHFISGPSYYTYFLSQTFAETSDVSVILMRALVPRFLYPGRERVGAPISGLSTSGFASTFDGIDWTLVPSLPRAVRFFKEHRPDVLVLEWWSASCLPSYLVLSRAARRLGIPVVLELHEELHASEARVPLFGPLAGRGLRHLVATSDAYVVHSPSDGEGLMERYSIDPNRLLVVHHGPFNMAGRHVAVPARHDGDPRTILFFGTVRPYKGLEVLVEAFDRLSDEQPGRWRLVVVGEPWEGWRLPFDKIAASPHRASIETVARYVRDEEIPEFFARADVVVLPYLESSASGPLHLTMAAGLPVVVTNVGGLGFAVSDYKGAVLVPPADATALADGVHRAEPFFDRRFDDPHSWERTRDAFEELFVKLLSD
jgi:glycosyltransferase involved in cell wall biosynthesis